MHKVKDAVTGHHDHKGSSHDSSQMSHKTDDTRVDHGERNIHSSAMGSEASNTSGINPQETGIFGSNKGKSDSSYASNNMNPSTDATTSTGAYSSHAMGSTGNHGSGYHGKDIHQDSRMAVPMQGPGHTQGSDTMGTTGAPNTYNSSYAGGYGAAPSHGLSDTTHSTNIGGTHDSNTGSNAGSNMVPHMKADEPELHSRTGQQGFGGTAAAGGSSNNTQESGKRRSSGPHNSNLLNKLDPRVKSSDYESNTASGQQRGW